MKKYFFIIAVAVGLVACGDSSEYGTGSGSSIDSASSEPMDSRDNTTVPSDSSVLDSGQGDINSGGSNPETYPATPERENNESR